MVVVRIRAAGAFLAIAAFLVGCGGGTDSGDVSGTVVYDGKPIEEGSISFTPEDGNGPTAGGSIKSGKYTAPKVHLGTAKVSISGAKVTGSKKMYPDDPKSPVVITSTEMLPEKYNQKTELRYDVKSGAQTKDFDLSK
ncbi:MAG: hypothetical protein K8U57_35000 [Planctomycetes bacterium]|nr:hypothetical protein [Planctomycetota bacterium]